MCSSGVAQSEASIWPDFLADTKVYRSSPLGFVSIGVLSFPFFG